jgi:hypothetical protein
MKNLASITILHRDKADHKVSIRLDRVVLMTVAAIVAATIVLVPSTTRSRKFVSDTPTGSDVIAPGAAHVVVHGLHVAIPNSLAHSAIEQLIPLP